MYHRPRAGGILPNEPGPTLGAAESLLRMPPPEVSKADAERFALAHYGVEATARLLSSERDRNFLLSGPHGWSAVLKFYNAVDDAPTRSLQHGALMHIRSRDAACPVPRIHTTSRGEEEVVVRVGGVETAAVMISRLPGVNPTIASLSPELRKDVGRVVGSLSAALADYHHPCADRALLWDLMLVAELCPLVELIIDGERRASMLAWLDHFSSAIRPAAAGLPHQAIHNDVSLSNLLIDPAERHRVTGVIDFGDLVRAPRINELAIAASYFVGPEDDLAISIAEILEGIGPGLRLTTEEVALLPALVQARLATRILLSEWRGRLFPKNRAYIMRSNQSAWRMWERLAAESPEALADRIATLACGVLA
jgi:hydroxylysine kinase